MVKEDWKNREIEIIEDEEQEEVDDMVAKYWADKGSAYQSRGGSGKIIQNVRNKDPYLGEILLIFLLTF